MRKVTTLITIILIGISLIFMFYFVKSEHNSKIEENNDLVEDSPQNQSQNPFDNLLENLDRSIKDSNENHFGTFSIGYWIDDDLNLKGYKIWVGNNMTEYYDANHKKIASFDEHKNPSLTDWTPEELKTYDYKSKIYMFGKIFAEGSTNIKTGWKETKIFSDEKIVDYYSEKINDPDIRYHQDPFSKTLTKISATDLETGKRAYYDPEGKFLKFCEES